MITSFITNFLCEENQAHELAQAVMAELKLKGSAGSACFVRRLRSHRGRNRGDWGDSIRCEPDSVVSIANGRQVDEISYCHVQNRFLA